MHHNDVINSLSPKSAYLLLLSGLFFFHQKASSHIGFSQELAGMYINNIRIPTRKHIFLVPTAFYIDNLNKLVFFIKAYVSN